MPDRPETFSEAIMDFAVALYRQLRQRRGNLAFSPFSIRAALGMAYAGARGETAAQMREALRAPSLEERMHATSSEIIRRLGAAGGGEHEMTVANSLWGQSGSPLRPEFLDLIARHYGGGVNVVDFRHRAEEARAAMNRWVEDRTRQRIRELISPGALNDLTRLVILNAVYFKGAWTLPFEEADTRDEPFHLEGGETVQAPLMRQLERVGYMEAPGYQAVDLLYRGGGLLMLVLLPDRKDGLRDLEEALTARMLDDCLTRSSHRVVDLFLPRFRITWGAEDLCGPLTALGMPLAFVPFEADFSGINGVEPPAEDSLFIAAVFHKAFVETNEKGTEAAAATAIFGELGASLQAPSRPPPIPVFRADHPFLFAIVERKSGAILFLGRVADPTKES